MARALVGVILAAGVGSRLRPYTDDRPKCLVPIGDSTILGRMLAGLVRAGVHRVVLSTGYRADRIADAVAGCAVPCTRVDNPDYATTQNMVSLARAMEHLHDDEHMVKLDGDVLFDDRVLASVVAPGASARVAVERSSSLGTEEMKVRLDGDRVIQFGKEIAPADAHGESIGIEYLDPQARLAVTHALRRALANGHTDRYYEDVYNDVLDTVRMTCAEVTAREWMEVDDADDLARARARFAQIELDGAESSAKPRR